MPASATKTEMVHARIEPRLKRSAERVFSRLGLSTGDAIRIFLRQVELHRGLPFSVAIPNEETIQAMKEANEPSALKSYKSFREIRKDL